MLGPQRTLNTQALLPTLRYQVSSNTVHGTENAHLPAQTKMAQCKRPDESGLLKKSKFNHERLTAEQHVNGSWANKTLSKDNCLKTNVLLNKD